MAEPELNGFGVTTSRPGLKQVVPVFDALRVARTRHDGDYRSERNSVVGVLVPVLIYQTGIDQTGDVGLDGEVDEVCLGTVLHLARLGRPRRRRKD